MNNTEIRAAILKALAGSSSQQPVVSGIVVKAALRLCPGVSQDGLMRALEDLLASREINTALVIKGGTQSCLYWLTGSASQLPAAAFLRQYPPIRQPEMDTAVVKMQPKTSIPPKQKEKNMSQHPLPITDILVEIVSGKPGIAIEPLIALGLQRVKGITDEHARKCVQNLIHSSKRLRQVITNDGARTFYPNDGKATKVALAKPHVNVGTPGHMDHGKTKKIKIVRQPVGASSLGCPAKSFTEAKPIAAKAAPIKAPDDDFSVVLTEKGHLIVDVGFGQFFILTHAQAERLYRFIGKVHPVLDLPS